MPEWISIEDGIPCSGQRVKIKVHYDWMSEDEVPEAVATFCLYDIDKYTAAWGWTVSGEYEKTFGTLRPTHWRPLPNPPEGKNERVD